MSGKQTAVIYGGGLAGLSLGIALRQRNVPVELHEAGTYPRHRVCGEFIAGADMPLFEELGIAGVFGDALSLETTVWHCGERQVMSKRLPSPVVSISRYTLDERLSRLFTEKGGVLYCSSRIKEDAVEHEGAVWATGRRPTTQDRSTNGWIGLKCHASGLTLKGDLEFFIGRKGYLGISPVSEDRFNVCGLFRLNRRLLGTKQNLFNRYLEDNGLQHLITRMEEAQVDPESWCAVAGLDYRNGSTNSNGPRVGDQFGLIAPLTGNGMSIAFESAALAAPFIESWARHKCSWQETIQAIHHGLFIWNDD
jgi:flavin-dependent dehydrogenase